MQKLKELLSSFILTAILLATFAIGAGVATFIENDYGSMSAKVLVYNALWFEGVIGLLALNLTLIIVKTKMWRKPSVVLLHSSFLMILAGAAITHFFGFEGVMHIRDAQTSDSIISSQTYISVSNGNETTYIPANFSPIYAESFNKSVDVGSSSVYLRLKEYIPNAVKTVTADKNGTGVVSLMIAGTTGKPEQYVIGGSQIASSFGLTFGFTQNMDIRFATENDKVFVISQKPMKVANLADDTTTEVPPKEPVELTRGKLYTTGDVRFVPKALFASGKITVASQGAKGGESALVLEVKNANSSAEINVFGQPGEIGTPSAVTLGDKTYKISFGAKEIKLPFSLTLEKFELQRYPGSMSPSSYSSLVKVNGKAGAFDYSIYMNHVLDYEGYRFFQSSYDMDEGGTVLSVSKDPGKIPTYIGYFLLSLGIFASFFNPRGRLWTLGKKLVAPALALFIITSQNSYANDVNASAKINSLFGQILVQDFGGRIKPIESLAIDIVDKISGQSSLDEQSASGVLLSMMTFPKEWENLEMIKVSHPKIKELLGLKEEQKKATFASAFTDDGRYKLSGAVDEANRKPPSKRDTFDKEVLKADERLNVCMMVFTGQFLRIFPKPNDVNSTWLDPQSAITTLPKDYSAQAINALQGFFGGVEADNLQTAEASFKEIRDLQIKYGGAVVPSQNKIDAELFYNKAKIFQNLILVYLFAGLTLFSAQIMMSDKYSKALKIISRLAFGVMFVAFVVQTFALILRWYVSGHAPWSDGYESMVYISWSAVLAGLIFYRFLPLALAMTGILASAMLLTAHIGFVDPQITNIVPVLKSYWLNIHVSLITASYGFLGLGFFLGLLSLGLFATRNEQKPERDALIKKIAIVNEMTIIVGLGLLTIGNFLGGVWANESWGRYWGWDPKETWALVSILVYTIVAHARFIPKLKSVFAFSALSVFAFSSILMTYFGVNYYLSGMHSYASGDPVPIPWFVWVGIIFVFALFSAAFRKRDLI